MPLELLGSCCGGRGVKLDEDRFGFDAHRKDIDPGVLGRVREAGVNIEGPRVPGAENRFTLDPSLAEGTGAVRAEVIEGVEVAIEPRQTKCDTPGFGFDDGTVGRCLT